MDILYSAISYLHSYFFSAKTVFSPTLNTTYTTLKVWSKSNYSVTWYNIKTGEKPWTLIKFKCVSTQQLHTKRNPNIDWKFKRKILTWAFYKIYKANSAWINYLHWFIYVCFIWLWCARLVHNKQLTNYIYW